MRGIENLKVMIEECTDWGVTDAGQPVRYKQVCWCAPL